MRTFILVLFSFAILRCHGVSIPPKTDSEEVCNLPQDVINDIASYANVTNQILNYFISGPLKGVTWKRIADFVDKFGARLTGEPELEEAIDYMVQLSATHGLENVHTEELEVPHWVRGEESVTLLQPMHRNMPMLGLGTSVATSTNGITAEAVVVRNFEELRNLSDSEVQGKIVVYCQSYTDYSSTVPYRRNGAAEASKKGAVAALVKSIAPFSIATPHTGSQYYQENVTRIPAAAVTHEDADFVWRQQQRGVKVVLNIKMLPKEDTKISRNFISEITGSDDAEKIVVVSAHIDSWDVGVGAMDDAGGCFISWLAPMVLKQLNLRPRRTLRTILFTAEEEGIIGANVYAAKHQNESDNLNFVMESDFGTFAPLGLLYAGNKTGECMVREVMKHFVGINASALVLGNPGPDIRVWVDQGIPGGGLYNANDRYFWFHHTMGDTINVLNSEEMDRNAGFWTAISYVIADMKHDMPRESKD